MTVDTAILPHAGGLFPHSASAPTAEITHTGFPRKDKKFPLSAIPVQCTVRPPAVSVQG